MKYCLYTWKEIKPLEMITVKTEIRRDKHDPKFTIELYPNIMELYMTREEYYLISPHFLMASLVIKIKIICVVY